MKKIKQFLSAVLLCALLLPAGAVCVSAAQSTYDVTVSMDYYRTSVYKDGWYWDGGDINTSYSSAQCSSSNCTCNTFYGSSQCHGFALYLAYRVTGSAPQRTLASYTNGAQSNGWTCYTLSALGTQGLAAIGLQPGDIVRASTDPSYGDGHTAMVWKIEDGKVYFAECWGSRHCRLYWGGFNYSSYSLSAICSRYSYVAIWRNSSVTPGGGTACRHSYVRCVESTHPHAVYYRCESCGDSYYTGEYDLLSGCPCCEGVHDWEYDYEDAHPHYQFRICRICGKRESTGVTTRMDGCPECAGLPYELTASCAEDSVAVGALVHITAGAQDAYSVSVDVYRDGMLYTTINNPEGGSASLRMGEIGTYTLVPRASNSAGEATGTPQNSFTVRAHVTSVTNDAGSITIAYSDPLTRLSAEAFCAERGGALGSVGGSGFTLVIPAEPLSSVSCGTSRYEVWNGAFSWDEAAVIAEAFGGELASCENSAQNAACAGALASTGLDCAWLGASDEKYEAHWYWTDGEGLTYTNWSLAHTESRDTCQNWMLMFRSGDWCEAPLCAADGFIVRYNASFAYCLNEAGEAVITRYLGGAEQGATLDVVIPDTVGGTAVTGFDATALSPIADAGALIGSVTLPAGVTYIADGVLDGCGKIYCPRSSASAALLDRLGVEYGVTLPFKDVAAGKWYSDAVNYCYRNYLLEGISADEFAPNAAMTRAMFVCVLGRMAGIDPSLYTGSSFDDVAVGKWYSPYIEWAYQSGIAAGSDGKFMYKAELSREQLCTFMYAYARFAGENISARADLGGFADADGIHSWALDAVGWAYAEGLIAGTDKGLLMPRDTATRAQVCIIVRNYLSED